MYVYNCFKNFWQPIIFVLKVTLLFFFEYSYARINVIVVNNSSRINNITIKSAVFTKQSKLEGPQ